MSEPIIKRICDNSPMREKIANAYMNTDKIKTRIQWGYDLTEDPLTGVSQLGEVIGESENTVVLGGKLYMLERIFGVRANTKVEYLNNFVFDGSDGNFPAANLGSSENYTNDHRICLFNVGIGGCGSSYTDISNAKIQDRIIPGMIPFRVTPELLSGEESSKYAFVRQVTTEDGTFYEYYLKRFDKDPTIFALWKDTADGSDGTSVGGEAYNDTRSDQIEVFVEIVLTISSTDLREYFNVYAGLSENIGPEHARFNTLGLCSGSPVQTSFKGTNITEYSQVLQETILTFGNELLHMDKDLKYIYRLYK